MKNINWERMSKTKVDRGTWHADSANQEHVALQRFFSDLCSHFYPEVSALVFQQGDVMKIRFLPSKVLLAFLAHDIHES